jgi:hypothetical protein
LFWKETWINFTAIKVLKNSEINLLGGSRGCKASTKILQGRCFSSFLTMASDDFEMSVSSAMILSYFCGVFPNLTPVSSSFLRALFPISQVPQTLFKEIAFAPEQSPSRSITSY